MIDHSFKKNKYTVIKKVISEELTKFCCDYFALKREVAHTMFNARYISPFTEYFSEVKSISECTKIVDETNGKINDPHFSEKGHIELSEKLLKMLEFYDKKSKMI